MTTCVVYNERCERIVADRVSMEGNAIGSVPLSEVTRFKRYNGNKSVTHDLYLYL